MTIKQAIKNLIKKTILARIIVYKLPQQDSRSVLFTFDDGPHKEFTPQVLSLLDDYGINAVFFLVGKNVVKHPEIVKEIVSRGHLVGNHTYEHPKRSFRSLAEYKKDVLHCQDVIEQTVKIRPVWFRPPRGTINLPNLIIPRKLGLKSMLWSAEGGEWGVRRDAGVEEIVNWLNNNLCPRDIVLFHDDNPKTPLLLKQVLPLLVEKQFKLGGALDELRTLSAPYGAA